MRLISIITLIVALTLSPAAFAQSPNVSQGLGSISQLFGLGSQLLGVGQQARTWESQPSGNYYQVGQPCFIQDGGKLTPGRFYPVEKGGRTDTECVATTGQP